MILFIIKGLIRDSSRSLFPVLIVSLSVAIVVLAHAYIEGALGDIIEVNARFEAGHVKIMTNAYQKNQSLKPNDLALTEISPLINKLKEKFPSYTWHPRIQFGGLLDMPDPNGETLEQGTVVGIAANIIDPKSEELDNLNLKSSLIQGRLPKNPGEILVTDPFFRSLGLEIGQKSTLIASTMEGGTAVANFIIVGTISFGIGALDRGAILADIKDIQEALYMEDGASEILGFISKGFNVKKVLSTQLQFKNEFPPSGKFSPVMTTIRDKTDFASYIDLGNYMGAIMIVVFVFIITLVLWNSGIRNGIRRYSEFGIRIAIGEEYKQVYFSQVTEALIIGIIGSVLGTFIGLLPSYYLQEVGLDISDMMDTSASTIIMQNVIKAKITTTTLWIGFIPGVFSTVFGALISGLGIFKRNTAQLFKELEV